SVIEGELAPRREACRIVGPLDLAPAGCVFEAELGGARVIAGKLDGEEAIARARAALALDHPAIARCIAVVELDAGPMLLQERVVGRALAEAASGADDRTLLALVDQVLAALEHAHGRGVTHGDLRGEDIVIHESGAVKVLR